MYGRDLFVSGENYGYLQGGVVLKREAPSKDGGINGQKDFEPTRRG